MYKPKWYTNLSYLDGNVVFYHYPLWDAVEGRWYPWSFPIYLNDLPRQLPLFDIY